MNRIYKIIWSRARNCYVVVSELAKRNGKCSSSLNKKIIASFLAAGVTVTSSIVTEAADPVKVSDRRISNVAAGIDDNDAVNVAQLKYAIDSGYINFAANAGENQKANFGDTVTIKGNAVTVGSYSANNMKTTIEQDPSGSGAIISVQIADNPVFNRVITTQIGNNSTGSGTDSLAWGNGTASGKQATAWGKNTKASGNETTAFGADTTARGDQATAWGIATEANKNQSTAWGNSTKANGDYATAWGNNTKATGQGATTWGDWTEASAEGATAFGNNTKASGSNSTAWGVSSKATNTWTTAFGYNTTASAIAATAFGESTTASGRDATAFGLETTASGSNSTASGYKTTASGWGATAAGRETTAGGNYAHAWGYGATTSNEDATAFGYYTTASGYESTAWGQYSKANGEASTAWGYNSQAIGKYSTAFGNSSMANAENSLAALGATTTKEATNSFAIGSGASANVADSIALGSGSVADRGPATIAGYNPATGAAYIGKDANSPTWKSTLGAMAVGNGSTATRQITGVAAGSADTDAVNVAQLRVLGNAVKTVEKTAASATDNRNVGFITNAEGRQEITSPYIHVEGVEEAARKFNDDLASYMSSSSYTSLAEANKAAALTAKMAELRDKYNFANAAGMSSIAIGQRASATKNSSLAVGPGTVASGEYSTAVGYLAKATGYGSTALGYGSIHVDHEINASGAYSTAIGQATKAMGQNSTALGSYTQAIGEHSTAMGYLTYARGRTSTAFGDGSEAKGESSTAFGYNTHALGDQSTAFGGVYQIRTDSNSWFGTLVHAFGKGSTAFGAGTWAQGDYSTAFGALTVAKGKYSTAFGGAYLYYPNGPDATEYTPVPQGEYVARKVSAIGDYSTAFGAGSRAEGDYSTAFGVLTSAIGKYSTAFGNASVAAGENSLAALGGMVMGNAANSAAIGKDAKASLPDTVSLGSGSHANRDAGSPGYDSVTGTTSTKDDATWKATKAAISIGDSGKNITRQITGLAAGSADTDAVNVAQLKRVAERIAPAITIKAGDNITIDEITNAAGSIEYTIHAQGFGGTGTGSNISSDNRAVTLTPNKDTDEKSITSPYLHINGLDKAPTADYAKADGTDSIAIGRSATVTEIAPRGVAIGNRAMVNNKDAVALGSNASATNHFSVALGPNAEASIHTSVALGSHSVTTAEDKAGIRTGKYGYDVVTNSQYKGVDRFSPTWQSTAGSVSVGGGVEPATGDTVTRRISNVAAGIKDTDVVNVAQLKRATNYLTDHRSTSIGTNANGEREIVSPYLAMHGVEEAAQAKSLINAYGQVKDYTDALQKDISTLKGEKASLNRDVTNLTNQISDLDARMAAINDKKSEAYKDLADERAILNEEKATLSKELNEVTEMLAEREGLLKTAETDYNKAKDLASDHAYVEGEKSFAQGSGTKVVGKESMAQGSGSTVIGDQSMAIGTGHEVYGSNSGAIGDPNVVAADESYAIGNNNNIGGVTKDKADIKTKNIFVYGNSNKIEAGKSHVYVLGSNVTTVESNSVILGNESAVYAEANNRTAGTGAYKSETINGKTYNYAGGDNEVGVVSVGNADAPRRIQNVAPGKVSAESTDAINGSQLYGAMTEMNNNVNSQIGGVEHRMKKGLAGAAALAALHPLDFDPDDKLTFAAGMGHYRGENAAALGMFYRPDEKVMFSVGGTMGNGENMINAGVSFSLDRTARVTGSRTALTKEVVQLREHVAKQDAQIAELTALVKQLAGNAGLNLPAGSALPGAPALFPDNLDNKWAYDTLEELEQKGYITGYAGRSLTRDEFAAALDRAMAGGAKLDERLIQEFEPELSHVRVAHVEGHGNNESEWYERPRASHDKLEDKHEIDKKHFRVQEKKVTSKS